MQRANGLQNQQVVIIGGSSGIGLAVAEQAASQGAKVVVVSSNAERLQKAIKSIGGEAEGQAVDVSDERAVETFFKKLGAFDHLVFTAGDSLSVQDLGTDEWFRRSAGQFFITTARLSPSGYATRPRFCSSWFQPRGSTSASK
jgi:NAD(P)-dependent dehydrogenase (short-subunit alcohol dehydrogenase family)